MTFERAVSVAREHAKFYRRDYRAYVLPSGEFWFDKFLGSDRDGYRVKPDGTVWTRNLHGDWSWPVTVDATEASKIS